MDEHPQNITIYSYNLEKPPYDGNVEEYYRQMFPGVQIRIYGLGYGSFPHPKKIPYIGLYFDGCGDLMSARYFYLK